MLRIRMLSVSSSHKFNYKLNFLMIFSNLVLHGYISKVSSISGIPTLFQLASYFQNDLLVLKMLNILIYISSEYTSYIQYIFT